MSDQPTAELTVITAPSINIDVAGVISDMAGQLAPSSKRIYLNDLRHFTKWLDEHDLTFTTTSRSHMIEYRQHLAGEYAKATASRMWSSARRFFDEAVKGGYLSINPAQDVRGFKGSGSATTPRRVLTLDELRKMLQMIDQSTSTGARDFALVQLLVRTGIRRAECASLLVSDLASDQGYSVIHIRHGKGDKARTVKLPADVKEAIDSYLEQRAGGEKLSDQEPLFVRMRGARFRDDVWFTDEALGVKGIERLVHECGLLVDYDDLTPHSLRATFVTLTLEGGAKLEQVQYFVGHSDPRTTERYQARKLSLVDSAADYLRLNVNEEPTKQPAPEVNVPASDRKSQGSPNQTPVKMDKEPPAKTIQVRIYMSVENNNSFVRGRKKSIEQIETYVFSRYKMKKPYKDRGEYILTIEYQTDKDLEREVYDLMQEAQNIADDNYCFTEMSAYALDGSERHW